MAQMCDTCRHRPAAIHCLTEATKLCFSCDSMRHRGGDAEHIRYQICEKCWVDPAVLFCFDHRIAFCKSCYSHYNCASFGHRFELVNLVSLHVNNNNNHVHHHHQHEHMPHVVYRQNCEGHNNCERWMFAMNCESCVEPTNAVVYCAQHDLLLCDNCDRMIHCLQHQPMPVPPHIRFVLCVSCKRLSRNFLIETSYFSLPPTHPPAVAEEVSALSSTAPSQ